MFVILMFVIPEGNLHFPYPFPVIIRRATKQPAVALPPQNNRFALIANPISPTLKFP